MLFIAFFLLITACSIGSAMKETRLSTNKADQWNPSIWRDYIVWQDARNGGSDIYLTDMAKKIQTRVTKGVNAENPYVSGNRIVWDDNRSGNYDIYMYEVSTKKTTRVTTNKSNQSDPAIYGNYIVWIDERNGYDDVYLQDLSTKKQTKITTKANAITPGIYENKIVWTNDISAYMYDIKTKKTVTIADPYTYIVCIYGTKILYYNYYDAPRLYLYDYSKDKTTRAYWPDATSMYSNKLVYADNRNGNLDIYMTQI